MMLSQTIQTIIYDNCYLQFLLTLMSKLLLNLMFFMLVQRNELFDVSERTCDDDSIFISRKGL